VLLATSPLAAALGLALALFGLPRPAAAQATGSHVEAARAPESFVHESWTVADGLPVNSINALLQSRDGYIWAATYDGLVRFDGVRFTVFNTANSPGLPNNRITNLLEARDGALWLRTEQSQLVRFHDGVFTHLGAERGVAAPANGALYQDASGTLWVGTERGLGFIRDNRLVPVAAEVIRGRVAAIVERRDGSIWAGLAAGGLFRIQGDSAQAIAALNGLAAEGVTALYEDPLGTLWIGTTKGVWRYGDAPEPVLRTDGPLGFRASPRTAELWVQTLEAVYRQSAPGAMRVLERATRSLRFGLLQPDEAGRMLYALGPELHREGRRIYSLRPEPARQATVHAWITAITLDHEGSLWLGTNDAGLHRLKPAAFTVYSEAEGLSHRNVLSVYGDREGTLWIGTAGETNRLERGLITTLPDYQGYARSFLQDRAGRLWVGGRGRDGLTRCPQPGLACERVAGLPIQEGAILAMHEDPAAAIWIGTEDGLLRSEGAGWHRFTEAEGAPVFPVRVFQQTRDGALWMGSNGGGLARYDQGRFRNVTTAEGLPLDLVRSLHEDADGWLWVGTEGRGLARLDPREWQQGRRGGQIVSYRTQVGLFDDVIHQILEDDFGRLWMSSNRGIFWVPRSELLAFAEGRTRQINSTSYTERDGLRNRETNGGSQPAGVKTRDGRLWFPTQDGVAVVDPTRIQGNRLAPNVVIEQVTAGGTPLRQRAGVLELGVEHRDLEIEYTALSFLASANVRFRYRLEPYDKDWVDVGSRRTAYYTRVPPGRYTFRVIASNNDGVWNEVGASLALALAPRFHETAAFRVLLVSLAGLLIASGLGWRVRSLRARARELARLVDERTAELRAQKQQLETQAGQLQALDRAKSHFFANVTHEFRTPLTLILGPLQDLARQRDAMPPAVLRPQVDMMTRNAQRLLRLVNQVLDLARMESGALTLSTARQDLVEVARGVTLSFTPLAERRGIALRFHAEAEAVPVQMDAEQMEKVLLNLLSNAFKFTEPGGRVEVTLKEEQGTAVVEVRDSGIGIDPEKLPHVFERFYQADSSPNRRYEGTGIGLSLVRELVELHSGTVSVQSRPGEGSIFAVRLPSCPHTRAERGTTEVGVMATGPGNPLPRDLDGNLSSEEEPADTDRTTVLVVDDNADIRAYVRSVLEPIYRVLEADNGEVGLERALEALPDLVIADVMMPHRDGFSLARALREDAATDCIPVILLTARAAPGHEVEGLGAGVDDYITKPFDAGVLAARVANLIASRRRLRERFRQEGVPARAESPAPSPARSELEEQLRAIIDANLTEPDFNPEALAAAAGLSYKRLYRRLAAELEATPSQFIRVVRVERASELLREGAGSVTEIAYAVGFNSLSHFHSSFRSRFGTSPLASRRTPA